MAQVAPQGRTRLLLVEDNPADADLVRISLDEADGGAFEMEHVTTIAEAVARVAGPDRPDAVLLDLSLPDAFGLDGLRRLKEVAPDVPVVVLTGTTDGGVGRGAIQAGAQDYLTKGSDAALVPRAVRYAIERHEQAAQARLLAEERAARAAAEAARERLAVLAAASTAVSHSLEDHHALGSLASALVPRFSDWCAIALRPGEQEPAEWTVAHRDAAAVPAVRSRVAAPGAVPEAPWGPGPSNALGAPSAMVVPLRLVDEVLGTIVFAASGRRFGPDDLALAEEIGRRAGIAVANCRLYREARRAVAVRDEFLSVAAHELKTPLTVLQLKLQQVELKQQASLCATCEHAVPADYRGTARQISRLGHLVEELLDVSRVVGGGVRLEREDLDLCRAARDAIERVSELAARNRSPVVLRCDGGPVRGPWDRIAVDRILGNLLSNALKFGVERPVDVRVGVEGEQAVIEVEDRGIGIAPEDLDRIFDRFERAVSSRHFGGLGLGLYIARRLVEAHGGTITASSRPGAGSTFTVRLPRAVRGAPPSGE